MKSNGEILCECTDAWKEEVALKVTENNEMLTKLAEYAAYLPKLDTIANSMAIIEDRLISAAIGKDHIETKTVYMLLKIFGFVIVGLTFVIVFLLTGVHLGWISQLHQ